MSFVQDIMRGLGRMAAQALQKRIQDGMTDTAIIDEESIIPLFDNDKDYTNYPRGFAVRDNEQVYGLLQPYNAKLYPNTPPSALRALWGLKHTTNAARAKPYVEPLGTSGLYMFGECCIYEGKTYRSLIENNSWTPTGYPQGWEVVE